MTTITNGSPTQPLLPVVSPSESGSSLQLTALAHYIKQKLDSPCFPNNKALAEDVCKLVNGQYPTDDSTLSDMLLLSMDRVNAAADHLRSTGKSVAFYLTKQRIDEIEATGVLYQALRDKNLIQGELSSNVEVQRAAIAAVDVAQVTDLNLAKKKLKCVPREIDRFRALRILRLNGNQIGYLPLGIFDNLRALQRLYLSHNQLTDLPPGIFDKLTALRILYLGFNQLTSLPNGVFDHLTALIEINLTSNQINRLPNKIFDNLSGLHFLYLDNNHLTSLLDRCFDKLIALNCLSLKCNQFTRLSGRLFANLTALQNLWLWDTPLEEIPPLPSRVKVY